MNILFELTATKTSKLRISGPLCVWPGVSYCEQSKEINISYDTSRIRHLGIEQVQKYKNEERSRGGYKIHTQYNFPSQFPWTQIWRLALTNYKLVRYRSLICCC